MKKANTILAMSLLIMAGLGGCKQSDNQSDDFITVDVTKSYSPKKELILQDFMDVEYVALETNDDFLNQGIVQDIGKEIILVRNRTRDGDIFVYDRTGKALRKINRRGQGSEEYLNISGITLDEDNNEMFVHSNFLQKIFVYDLYGKFKRSFKYKENIEEMFYTDIFNYDGDNLICYDKFNKDIAFVLISKQDGRITKEIKIPFKEKKILQQTIMDEASNSYITVGPPGGSLRSIIPFNGNWILLEISSDTVYTFLPDYSLRPFIVRTPPVQSMDPEVCLTLRIISDRYYFMEAIKNVFDVNTKTTFPKTLFMYDKQEKAFLEYIIYNGDFSTPKEVDMSLTTPVNHEIESWLSLEAYELVESYKKGELKGRLKDIAAKLEEDSNPVIMLIKHKK